MRRPEIEGFVAVAPPAGSLDFSFLAPCPASGLILHGSRDDVVAPEAAEKLAKRLAHQKSVVVEFKAIPGADHFFASHMPELAKALDDYLNKALTATA
jgi:alpha/beta superfamily hydrolase